MKQKLITLSILVISLAGTMTSLGGSVRSAAAAQTQEGKWFPWKVLVEDEVVGGIDIRFRKDNPYPVYSGEPPTWNWELRNRYDVPVKVKYKYVVKWDGPYYGGGSGDKTLEETAYLKANSTGGGLYTRGNVGNFEVISVVEN